ncbi:glycoside hydrolase domain-containing protein [Microbacterium sp. SORGH_AS_0428]|uniref:glycoside hydrolase domain-containing protein n=1 Tax=Microbacterium sp. SORGH_AS_0428 TaxID=3041788 RepID=UPI00286A10A8|nr:glycoside hydrolase domain-containing protein [Microbacterium sp. SORGH_AS_0428]
MWYNTTYGNRAGFQTITVDGQSGWQTMYALTRALQSELGITTLSDNFGAGTLAALTSFGAITAANPASTPANIVKIAQGALYCKGYNAGNGALTGVWDAMSRSAASSLRGDLGLSSGSSDLLPKLFKFLLTMDASVMTSGGDSVIRAGQRAMNARYFSRRDFYIVAADGHFTRDIHRALMFSLQYELNMDDGVANGNFGPGTKSGLQSNANLSVGSTDTSKYFVHWFNFILRINGYATTFSGSFTSSTAALVSDFQSFVGLPSSGTGNLATWASLLVSTGDPDRAGTGADCITTLTSARLSTLRSAGYTHFGRYLTNTPDDDPDKCLKWGEAERILQAGGRIFPLFQTGGGTPSHFTYDRGKQVAEEAGNAAWAYRLPANSIVYFSVDYDAYDWEVTDKVIPYFQGIRDFLSGSSSVYRVGIYGPRNVCARVSNAGLAVSSFVSDMSTGYSGNLGYRLPENWAFDQIQTRTVGSGSGAVEIDKNIVSGRDSGVSGLAPQIGVGNDPLIPSNRMNAFEEQWFGACTRYPDSAPQLQVMLLNKPTVRARVEQHDAFITSLAAQYGVYKALIMTPLIWESMVINALDDAADAAVRTHYALLEQTGSADPATPDDSSTGPCQVFARTAIAARKFAVNNGLLSEPIYNSDVWQDVWEVWRKLNTDEEYNIATAMFVMMHAANTMSGLVPSELRQMTPSQVIRMCYGYNGDMFYGRNRAQLYYQIHRWHDSFR